MDGWRAHLEFGAELGRNVDFHGCVGVAVDRGLPSISAIGASKPVRCSSRLVERGGRGRSGLGCRAARKGGAQWLTGRRGWRGGNCAASVERYDCDCSSRTAERRNGEETRQGFE